MYRSQSKTRGNSKVVTCWHCKKEGHLRKNCPSRKKGHDGRMYKIDAANLSDGYESGEGLIISKKSSRDEWILDSGCTFHMTPRKELLMNFKQIKGGTVLMGNDQSCNIADIRSVKFKMWDGTHRILENVRLVPDLRRNLISLGMLDSSSSTYKSEKGKLKVVKGSMVVLIGLLKQGLYILQGEAVSSDAALSSSANDDTEIWHKRLGHIGLKGLQELSK